MHRSTRVWTLYLDLEESLGTLETTKAAYDRCLELKVRCIEEGREGRKGRAQGVWWSG